MLTLRFAIIGLFTFAWAVVFSSPSQTRAFVPAEYSLAEVYRGADAVVVVRCGVTREVKPNNDDEGGDESFDHKTPVTLLKQLVGTAKLPQVFDVVTDHRASCDADLRFTIGSKALLFLKRCPAGDAYRIFGRSEGSFPLDDRLEEAMTKHVPELGPILALPAGAPRDTALTEFYVKLCLNPTMRGIGTHSLYLDTRDWLPLKTAPVNTAQYQRLSDTVVAERPPLDNSYALARTLAKFPDPKLDAYLYDAIRNWDQPSWSTLTETAVKLLPKRRNIKLAPELAADLDEHFRETRWDSTQPKTRKEEYYERMRPALMARLLEALKEKK